MHIKMYAKKLLLLLICVLNTENIFGQQFHLNGTSKYRGVLQYSSKGRWYNLCSDQWTIYNGDQVCEQLGFGYALEVGKYTCLNNGSREAAKQLDCQGNPMCKVSGNTCSSHAPLLSLECSGQNASSHARTMRLVDGPTKYEGRVELYRSGDWQSVCYHKWNYNNAEAVCKQLGYGHAIKAPRGAFRERNAKFLNIRFRCKAHSSLKNCDITIKAKSCIHEMSSNVVCSNKESNVPIDGWIFLTKGSFHPYAGDVIMYHNKTWWRIDDRQWDMEDAHVACRQMGFQGALRHLVRNIDDDSLPCLGNIECQGNESHLLNCSHEVISTEECHGVGIACVSTGSIRLVQGPNRVEGYVELFSDGKWRAVCNQNWKEHNANVVCVQLGRAQAVPPSTGNTTIYNGSEIGNQVYRCTGSEKRLVNCRFIIRASCDSAPYVSCQDRFLLENGLIPQEGLLFGNGYGVYICGHCWTWRQANAVCRELKYSYAIAAASEEAPNNVILNGVCFNCTGKEEALQDCLRRQSGNCLSNKTAFVLCAKDTLIEGSLRLVDSEAVRYGGNLQIFVNGQWRYVKSREWSAVDATVACKQMGFKSYNTVRDDSFIISSLLESGQPFCNFACDGSERKLLQCISSGLCNGEESYIGIVCSRADATESPTKMDATLIMSLLCAGLGIACILCILIAAALLISKLWRRRQNPPSLGIRKTGESEHCTHEEVQNVTIKTFSNLDADDEWEMCHTDFQLDKEIGSGCFGAVYKGVLNLTATSPMIEKYKLQSMSRGDSIYAVAVKVMKDITQKVKIEQFLDEMELMKKVSKGDNPHVIKMVGCVSSTLPLSIIMEYAPGGSLLQCLRDVRLCNETGKIIDSSSESSVYYTITPTYEEDEHDFKVLFVNETRHKEPVSSRENFNIKESDFLSCVTQITSGMGYLSSLGIVHRDLACRNILVGRGKVLKIADFGLARKRTSDEYISFNGVKLPIRWTSPEAALKGLFSEFSDVWSFGVCVWEIFSFGKQPYEECDIHEIIPHLLDGYRLERPSNCPDNLFPLVESCWNSSPQERPTFSHLHSVLSRIIEGETEGSYLCLQLNTSD